MTHESSETQVGGRRPRREAILAAALEEFARRGYKGASTNRVAEAAQVAKGLIFRHFGSKEGLFDAALERACERLFSPEDEALPRDPFARLEEFVVRRAARLAAHPAEARFVARFRGRLRAVLSPAARRIDEYYDRLRARFRNGADTRAFRPGIDGQAAVELLLLVAEGFERQALDALAAAAADGETESVPAAFSPEPVRERARALAHLLRRGIYRPGARASAPAVSVNAAPFLAALERLAPLEGPASEPADQRRQRILQAAQQLFAERDYEGVSVEAVAERAGVAKSLVFHHFGSKGELYLAAVADAAARISAILFERETGTEPDLFQRLLSWTQRKMAVFQEQPLLYGLVLSAVARPPDAAQEAVRQYVAEGTRQGWEIIMDGVDMTPFRPDVDPARAVELVMLVVDTLGDRLLAELGSHPDKGVNLLPGITEQAARYFAMLRDGLAPPATPRE